MAEVLRANSASMEVIMNSSSSCLNAPYVVLTSHMLLLARLCALKVVAWWSVDVPPDGTGNRIVPENLGHA